MRIHLIISFCFILPVLLGYAQEVRPYPMEEKALLWEIKGSGVQGPSFLFGTMHLMEKNYFYFPEKLKKIASESDVLVMETTGLPDPVTAMKYLTLEEGSLFDYFNASQTDSLIRWMDSVTGMNEQAFRTTFSKMKPFVIVQIGTQMPFMGETASYEMTLNELATTYGLKIKGLETIDQQIAFFDSLTTEQQTENRRCLDKEVLDI